MAKKFWRDVYGQRKSRPVGLEGAPVVSLTKGCQRTLATMERVENGVLPDETRIKACYGEDCWVNKQFNVAFSAFENMEIRDLKLADPEKFDARLSKPNVKNS